MLAVEVVLLAVFTFVAALKTWNLVASVRWALKKGPDYAKDCEVTAASRGELFDKKDRFLIINNHAGTFFPFGAKSVRLYFWTEKANGFTKVVRGLVYTSIGNSSIFFALTLGIIVATDVLCFSHNPGVAALGCVLAFWAGIYPVALLFEAIVWIATAKKFGTVWGRLRSSKGRLRPALDEFLAFLSLSIASLASATVLISATEAHYGSWTALSTGRGPLPEVDRLVGGAYYVLATLTTVGSTEISPVTTLARGANVLLLVLAVLLAGYVISSLAVSLPQLRSKT
jgi:hypothetical protein